MVSIIIWFCIRDCTTLFRCDCTAVSHWSRELARDTQSSTVPATHNDTFVVRRHTTRHRPTASNSRIAIVLAAVGLVLVVVAIAVIIVVCRRRGLLAFTGC